MNRQLRRYEPEGMDDIRQVIEQTKRELSVRRSASHQTRDYHIDCANGDQIDVHEETRIWIEETYG